MVWVLDLESEVDAGANGGVEGLEVHEGLFAGGDEAIAEKVCRNRVEPEVIVGEC